jgi:hypothetical protein
MTSEHAPGRTIREQLDYIVWVCGKMQELGFHGGTEAHEWRGRVQRAYLALFVPVVPGHGPPWPPDVPGARNPGIWPDVPAASIPGMTLRHQLASMEYRCGRLRDRPRPHMRPVEVADWDARFARARAALDHGPTLSMPKEARTEPSAAALAEAKAQAEAHALKARKQRTRLRQQMRRRQARTAAKKPASGAAKPKAKAKEDAKPKAAKKKSPAKRKGK